MSGSLPDKRKNDSEKYLTSGEGLPSLASSKVCKCKCNPCLMGGHCAGEYCVSKENLMTKEDVIEQSKFDSYFRNIKHPPKKLLKKYLGMVVTSVSREREQDISGNYTEKLNIDLDEYLTLEIIAKNGQVTIEAKPTGLRRLSTKDKIQFMKEKEVRE